VDVLRFPICVVHHIKVNVIHLQKWSLRVFLGY